MYSALIGFILTLMVLLFYIILSKSLSQSVENQLNLTSKLLLTRWKIVSPADELANPKRRFLIEEQRQKGLINQYNETYVYYDFVPYNQFFILMTSDGKIQLHSLQDSDFFSYMKSSITSSLQKDDSASLITVQYQKKRAIQMYRIPIKFLDGSVLFTGMETTDNVNLLQQMRWILACIAVLVLVFSIGIGYWFSGRAMIPIKRSYKRQQDFVADASHELRTPLSILHASVEILEEEQTKLPPFHQKVLADMKKELIRMTRMMEGLLTLARSDSGRLEIDQRCFDLKKMVETTLESFQLLADQQQIYLSSEIDLEDSDCMFYGDEERLKQLLYILLDNALKYSKSGGEIHLEIRKKACDMYISVSDTGIGIPQEEAPLIFERFYRVDKGRSRLHGGVGLGLSIAAWIVEAHGGQINASSRLGTGTTIQIIFPLSPPQVEEKKHD